MVLESGGAQVQPPVCHLGLQGLGYPLSSRSISLPSVHKEDGHSGCGDGLKRSPEAELGAHSRYSGSRVC